MKSHVTGLRVFDRMSTADGRVCVCVCVCVWGGGSAQFKLAMLLLHRGRESSQSCSQRRLCREKSK